MGFNLLAYETLGNVEHLDVMVSQDDGIAQFIANQLLCFVHFCFTDGKIRKFSFIELQLIFAYGLVATLLDISQYGAYRFVQLCQVETRARGNLAPQFPFRIFINLHNGGSKLYILHSTLQYHLLNGCHQDALGTHFLQFADNLPEAFLV